MATTDAKAGFRLPWSTDRQSSEPAETGPESSEAEAPAQAAGWPTEDGFAPASDASASDSAGAPGVTVAPPPSPAPAPVAPPPGRKPSRFMADLTKAMQAAAEDARSRALTQLQADAKTHVETIHGRSSTESAGLRRKADDDVAAVREWSKAEIARIREETEAKITERKARLETEIEQHASVIEREIDAVQKTVAAFEAEMAAFFERLLAEEDPSRFATMAENLPEPPAFEAILSAPVEMVSPAHAPAEAVEGPPADASPVTPTETFDREAAFAAIQAAAEAAEAGDEPDAAPENAADPRLAALGFSAGFDAAEAEAYADADESDEEVPQIPDEAVAARIAGLLPVASSDVIDEPAATQVVVVGLVSVASIASFKRHLGRLPGVQSVGVSSGPDGEFIFAVKHGPEVVLGDAVPSLPTFQARVTGATAGVVQVTAHDPESGA